MYLSLSLSIYIYIYYVYIYICIYIYRERERDSQSAEYCAPGLQVRGIGVLGSLQLRVLPAWPALSRHYVQ